MVFKINLIFLGGRDKKIFIWNTDNIEEPIKGPFEFQDGEITTLCFSYDNKHVVDI